MDSDTPRRRLTRAEAKQRTRQLLLEAAAHVFARRGFAGASVEEIAETAGFSIGALYSNFSSKEELFLELCATFNTDRISAAAAVLTDEDEGTERAAQAMGRVLVEAADTDPDYALLQAEFWLYATRNPHMLDTMAAQLRAPRAALERLVAEALADRTVPAQATPAAVAAVVAALFDGLVRQRRLDPDQVPDDLFGHTLRWLFAGIDATGGWPAGRAPSRKGGRTKTAPGRPAPRTA